MRTRRAPVRLMNERSAAPCGAAAVLMVDDNAAMFSATRVKTGFRPGGPPWSALVAGVLWLAAGLSAGYWILLASGRSPSTPVTGPVPQGAVSDSASVARILGARPEMPQTPDAPPPQASRYQLLGVADIGGPGGSALIAVDGQPPRPYRVGAGLDGGLILQSVDRRSVRLGATTEGPVTIELMLPAPPATN